MQLTILLFTAVAAISAVSASTMTPYAIYNGVVVKTFTGDYRIDAQECCHPYLGGCRELPFVRAVVMELRQRRIVDMESVIPLAAIAMAGAATTNRESPLYYSRAPTMARRGRRTMRMAAPNLRTHVNLQPMAAYV
ncbi:hypothetical protein EX30DRAFT_382109 [Ascodesmis nigricans]|uniref:Uncharacterized protein n=1 Tax=Ascodesmis nigricans TaxID=341454 RepID=A0A4S2MQE4_9PEZI|nr:hypothetical protein EX30DRAFT_382109 [Ascodesmis nigricans]